MRAGDLVQLERIAQQFATRERFLTELALDPPQATSDLAGAPLLDEDYLVLSTIHSAKGQEWEAVYVLNVADGNFPSEFSTGRAELIEEERRLLYVAMTRAQDQPASHRAAALLRDTAAAPGRRACVRGAQPLHDPRGAGAARAGDLADGGDGGCGTGPGCAAGRRGREAARDVGRAVTRHG